LNKKRDEFEEKAQNFVISQRSPKESNLTQEQFTNEVGTKKAHITA